MRYIHCLRQEKRNSGTFTCMHVRICVCARVCLLLVCMYVCVLEHHDAHVGVRGQLLSQFFTSVMWALRLELRSSGLVASGWALHQPRDSFFRQFFMWCRLASSSLHGRHCLWTPYPRASTSQVLGLHTCIIMPSIGIIFLKDIFLVLTHHNCPEDWGTGWYYNVICYECAHLSSRTSFMSSCEQYSKILSINMKYFIFSHSYPNILHNIKSCSFYPEISLHALCVSFLHFSLPFLYESLPLHCILDLRANLQLSHPKENDALQSYPRFCSVSSSCAVLHCTTA